MCYSAQIVDAWDTFVRRTGAVISLRDFAELYGFRLNDRSIRIPRAVDAAFNDLTDDLGRAIKADIESFNSRQVAEWEQELFKRSSSASAWPMRSVRCRRRRRRRPPRASASPARKWTGS